MVTMTTIEIPSQLRALNTLKFNKKFSSYTSTGRYVFDFSTLEFIEPFAMLFLAQSIREFIQKNNSNASHIALINSDKNMNSACGYLAHMGFFVDAGIKYGNQTGEASGGTRYIPITKIFFQNLSQNDKYKYMSKHELLEQKAKEMASVLVQSEQNDAYKILSYCIRESLRNAMEHSGADSVRICGQYWNEKNTAQIAILDTGIGILKSLKNNSIHQTLSNDTVALEHAIKPAVSSQPIAKKSNHDPWHNSGFGLYMLKKICKDCGSLLISSNEAALNIETIQTAWQHAGLSGTSLKVEINLSKLKALGTLEENLERYREESKVATQPSSSSMRLYT
jgi:hypothetical protein